MLVEERGFHSFREPFCQVVVQGADLGRRNTLVSRKGRFKDVDLGEKKKFSVLSCIFSIRGPFFNFKTL